MTPIPRNERNNLARAGLRAAGVSEPHIESFLAVTDEIVTTESAWNPHAIAADRHRHASWKGPTTLFGLFGGGATRVLTDGYPYTTPRGLAQLTPWIFQRYHAAETSTDIRDPIASIAALWRFIADQFSVDLTTGRGLTEFRELWYDHRPDWWWLTELAPFHHKPRCPGY